ncbi:MAG: ferritin-like domain-containing protein [Myxococcota bacterium]
MSNLPQDLPADFGAAIAKLGARERLEVEDMKLMILLETAGDPLYQKLADLVENEQARELLRANGREETAHAHRLKHAIEILTGEPFEIPSLDENPYAEPPPFTEVNAELLAGVEAGEIAGDAMYQRYAEHEPNAEVAELLRQNGREETRHGGRVKQAIALIS